MLRAARTILPAVFLLAIGFGPAGPANAAVITPTVLTDDHTVNGNCTLREAISAANNDLPTDQCPTGNGADTITLQAGTYTLSVGPAGDDGNLRGDLDVQGGDLTIQGQGPGATIIDVAGLDRGFHLVPPITPAVSVSISGVTIRGADSADDGGGILSSLNATLTLTDSVLESNHTDSSGGGMQTGGLVTIERTLFLNNSSTGDSGAIENFPDPTAKLTIRDSAFVGNMASGEGAIENYSDLTISNTTFSGNKATAGSVGAIRNSGTAALTIRDSAFVGNTASGSGAIENYGDLTIVNSTFSGNKATAGNVGAIRNGAGTMDLTNLSIVANSASSSNGAIWNLATATMKNSIVSGNTQGPGGDDCSGTITSGGGNVSDDGACIVAPADKLADPLVLPLADNGGPTPTHALTTTSPALGFGSGCPPADQRGLARSQPCDSGAYELVLCGPVAVNRFGTEANDTVSGTSASDGILGLGGRDVLKGKGGNDSLCGGTGKDILRGGPGRDRLIGEKGKDTCVGGPGRDRARSCEVKRSLR